MAKGRLGCKLIQTRPPVPTVRGLRSVACTRPALSQVVSVVVPVPDRPRYTSDL